MRAISDEIEIVMVKIRQYGGNELAPVLAMPGDHVRPFVFAFSVIDAVVISCYSASRSEKSMRQNVFGDPR